MNIKGYAVVWVMATITTLAGSAVSVAAESNAKALFNNSELEQLDQIMARPNAKAERVENSRALMSVFSSKALANMEEQLAQDISKGTAAVSMPNRAVQDQKIKEGLGANRLGRVRQFFQENLDSTDLRAKKTAIWWFLLMDPDSAGKSKVAGLLASKDANVRFEAARQLASLRKDAAGESVLLAELESRQISRSIQAAGALAKLNNAKARKKAFDIYSSTADGMSRGLALDILAEYKSAENDEILVRALDDSDPGVVSSALGRLQARGYPLNQHAIDRLFQIIDDRTVDSSTKMMAVWALQHSKDKARSEGELRQEFAGRLKSDDLGISAVAVTGLMAFGDKKDAKLLMPLLDHPNDALKAHVERTLGKLTGTRFDRGERDVKVIMANRKAWWAQHLNDPEYR